MTHSGANLRTTRVGLIMTPAEKNLLTQLAQGNFCSEADVIRRLILKEAKRIGLVDKQYDPIDD